MKKAHESILLKLAAHGLRARTVYARRRGRRGEAWFRDREGKRHTLTLKALDAMVGAKLLRFAYHGRGGLLAYSLTPEGLERGRGVIERKRAEAEREGED